MDRHLHPTLGHHRIGIPDTKLGGQDHLRPVRNGRQRGRAARAAPADDEHVRGVVGLQVHGLVQNGAAPFEQVSHLVNGLLPRIRPDCDRAVGVFLVIRMVFLQEGFLLPGREQGQALIFSGIPTAIHNLAECL